ncbi:MAG: nucleotidyltransferase [Ignavibacteria bacterium]|nr:nucleotidyltransferase [Ignavibacteria bacterium]
MLFNILDKKTFFKIDFIFTVRNELEDSMFKRKNKLKINGMEVYVISIEDLIIAKLNWEKESFPELQFRDIRQLMRNNIDKDYLTNWIVKLNLKDIYNKI